MNNFYLHFQSGSASKYRQKNLYFVLENLGFVQKQEIYAKFHVSPLHHHCVMSVQFHHVTVAPPTGQTLSDFAGRQIIFALSSQFLQNKSHIHKKVVANLKEIIYNTKKNTHFEADLF